MKLLVRNLPRSTTENDVRTLFSEHGVVAECTLVFDQETGKSKGFGFVEMPEDAEAKAAIKALHMSDVGGRAIRVKIAQG
ncbi:RNA recognition motif domain-containing protein [Aliagarivorans taiwanensis]|uniref:RNA recognition motif domain-containing protein n=1 Tax=Aliagarivorans taiwanensis TaxID=561966 RepID=UPI000417166A|nr:hypothetical protein [Aliagarivorans taiwanensis]